MKLTTSKRALIEREMGIESIAAGGDGLGFIDLNGKRRAVFVSDTAPGDRITVTFDPNERTLRGLRFALIASGPSRVEPECAHASECGGCNWMHLSPATQQETIQHLLQSAIPNAPIVRFHGAEQRSETRTRARLHIGGKLRIAVGFYAKRSHDIVEPSRCIVLHPVLEHARTQLPSWLEGASGSGEAQLALGHPEKNPRPVVLSLDWKVDPSAALFSALERAVASGGLKGASIVHEGMTRPLLIGDPTPWLIAADGMPLELGVGGFAQAAESANAQLVNQVAYWADELLGNGERRVVELYAGAGNLTTLLAKGADDYVLVESDSLACGAAARNMSARGLVARVIHADASTFEWKASTRLLVLDPPRAGAIDVMHRLVERPVRNVVYVSCDPSTLARDVAILIERGYELRALEAFEMFPYTSHFETVAVLTRKR